MDYFSKNKISVWIIVILVLLNLFTLSTIWYNQLRRPVRPPREEMRHHRQGLEMLGQKLKLTDEQVKIFEGMRQQHFEKMKPLQEEIISVRQQLMDELSKAEPDTALVNILIKSIGDKETVLERNRFEHFMELRSVCTPEQKEKFEILLRELMGPPSGMSRPGPHVRGFRPAPGPGPAPAPDDAEYFFR